jgi:hypothetical protein
VEAMDDRMMMDFNFMMIIVIKSYRSYQSKADSGKAK